MIGPLQPIDRTSPDFREDVDDFFLNRLPAWSAQLAAAEQNINEKSSAAQQAAEAAAQSKDAASESARLASEARDEASGHAASALAAAQAAQAAAGLPQPVPGAILRGKVGGGVEFAMASPAEFGLDKVNNTSDAEKPVSGPQAQALLAKAGGVATKLMHSYIDHGTIAAGGTVTLDADVAAVHRVQAAGALTLALANIPATGSGEMELLAGNFGGKAVTWFAANWIKADGSYATAVGNSGVVWQTTGVDRVLIMWDAGSVAVKVMR